MVAIKKVSRFFLNLLLFIFIQGLVFCTFSIPMVFYGPFQTVRDLFVTTAMTTFSHQYLAKAFLSDAQISEILKKNKVDDTDEKTDETEISIPASNDSQQSDEGKDAILSYDVSNSRMKAYMLVIKDPKRVSIGTSDALGVNGMKLADIVDKYNAAAAINAGGFADDNGSGSGGIPEGTLVSDGKILYGKENIKYEIIGFNKDNVLVLGYYTLQEIRNKGIRDATCFGPFLVVNGQPLIKTGNGGGGLQPRTVIGQRKDGAVLFLVIDGRQVSSVGATLKEAQDIMIQHGAYNAANLDGGASTQLIFSGQTINHPCSVYGPRNIPSAFIVR